jgi:hypothetical protein
MKSVYVICGITLVLLAAKLEVDYVYRLGYRNGRAVGVEAGRNYESLAALASSCEDIADTYDAARPSLGEKSDLPLTFDRKPCKSFQATADSYLVRD